MELIKKCKFRFGLKEFIEMIFTLYRLSYHPEYLNVRTEYVFSIDGYKDNIHDIVQAEHYFKDFLLNSFIKVVTPLDELSYTSNYDENDEGAIDLGFFIATTVDMMTEYRNIEI